ncbi:hypothetical protein NQ317_008743 [Molorchus minor]|uniref:Uncharacterized protein n=1 Tax=Molorchus minor TaxID=1323400 RepID=A0ABQ9JC96_9CUCU|nr:hypothetical protein NQ317_008743 [Molorchus minor]
MRNGTKIMDTNPYCRNAAAGLHSSGADQHIFGQPSGPEGNNKHEGNIRAGMGMPKGTGKSGGPQQEHGARDYFLLEHYVPESMSCVIEDPKEATTEMLKDNNHRDVWLYISAQGINLYERGQTTSNFGPQLYEIYKEVNKSIDKIFLNRDTEGSYNLTVERGVFENEQKFREYFPLATELFETVLSHNKGRYNQTIVE